MRISEEPSHKKGEEGKHDLHIDKRNNFFFFQD